MAAKYDDRTEELLAMLPAGLTEAEFAQLAMACADQAGADPLMIPHRDPASDWSDGVWRQVAREAIGTANLDLLAAFAGQPSTRNPALAAVQVAIAAVLVELGHWRAN